MERIIALTAQYLWIPVAVCGRETKVEFFLEGEPSRKVFEFMIPVGEASAKGYPADYPAALLVKAYQGRRMLIRAEAPESLLEAIVSAPQEPDKGTAVAGGTDSALPKPGRPALHFTPRYGWMNDPNGLVYADGVYHLYFQFNPFHICWNNMTWGHAVSRDLLHWEQKDAVLYPDEYGTVYSGSAIQSAPGELVCFYTAAGNELDWNRGRLFTQRMARSMDGGMSFEKYPQAVIDTVCPQNRDPKVFWHQESGAYICVLWLEEQDFGIFRSQNLTQWTQTDRVTLEGAWECPDLVRMTKELWLFTAADGYFFEGSFDGYRFTPNGVRHDAYSNRIPYAAQTYSGVEGRTVLIPWLRLPNDGRLFTGCMGIPMELTAAEKDEGRVLTLWPVREFWEHCCRSTPEAYTKAARDERQGKVYFMDVELEAPAESGEAKAQLQLTLGDTPLCYSRLSGILKAGSAEFAVGTDCRRLSFIVDERLLEVFSDGGRTYGACWLD